MCLVRPLNLTFFLCMQINVYIVSVCKVQKYLISKILYSFSTAYSSLNHTPSAVENMSFWVLVSGFHDSESNLQGRLQREGNINSPITQTEQSTIDAILYLIYTHAYICICWVVYETTCDSATFVLSPLNEM